MFKTNVVLDARWKGMYGIGRYSEELLARFDHSCSFLRSNRHPLSSLELAKSNFRKDIEMFYSPGFTRIRHAQRQLITVHDLIHLSVPTSIFERQKYDLFYGDVKRATLEGSVGLLTGSHHSKLEISDWIGIDAKEIGVIQSGLSDAFQGYTSKGDSREIYSIGFVGNNKKHKNFDFFIDLVNHLDSNWTIYLVGKDLDSSKIRDQSRVINVWGLTDNQLSGIYRKINVLVIPSTIEGFCLPALEGAASGCKVVHFGLVPTIKEILGENDFVLNKNDSISSNATNLESIALLASPYSETFFRDLQEKYSWNKSAETLKMHLDDFFERFN